MQRRRERAIVWTVAAVNLINVLDFAIVMPLGPDVAAALDVPVSDVGLLGSAYTFAAAAAGLLGSFFLDRFDRKRALLVAVLGLAAGTALAASATSLPWLLVGRAVAGLFGGPATSLSFSIVADVIPPDRRGKAIGLVMGAFSLASILGIPAGLELARRGTWSSRRWRCSRQPRRPRCSRRWSATSRRARRRRRSRGSSLGRWCCSRGRRPPR